MSGLEITLLRPLWLVALPLLAVFFWLLWRRRGSLGDWSLAADPELLRAMARLGHVDETPGRSRVLVWLCGALAVIVLALTGPAIERRDTLSFRNLDGVLFLVDASPSVTEDPRWPGLLTIGRFGLAALGTRPGGIIVYGGDAYAVSDMTLDHRQLGQTLSLIDAATVPDPGSRPERALDMAADRLAQAEIVAGDVLLFTDGEGLGPASLAATRRIAGLGARLSIVGLGAPTPEMEAHTRLGGGRVFGAEDVEALGRYLTEDARTRLEQQEYPLLFWRDVGRYLLLLALVPLALLFRRETA